MGLLVPHPDMKRNCLSSISTSCLIHLLSLHSSVNMSLSTNCICIRQTIPIPSKVYIKKLLMITFPSSFLIFITYCQNARIISCVLFTNNILINFDHTLWNLKHIIFLIVSTYHTIFPNFFLFTSCLTC